MNEELENLKKMFSKNQEELPLVLHDTNIIEKKYEISGKSIEVLRYRTTVFPLDKYYKHVTRISECFFLNYLPIASRLKVLIEV